MILIMFGVPSTLIGYFYTIDTLANNSIETEQSNLSTKMLTNPKILDQEVLPIMATNNVADVVEEIRKSVVSITSTIPGNLMHSTGAGLGSGFIFTKDEFNLYIMTNAHVLENAVNIVVTSPTLGAFKGEIVGIDPHTDIGVVSVLLDYISNEVKDPIILAKINEQIDIQVGDIVLAVGNPLDETYSNTVTMGVISALDRQTNLISESSTFIQTDTAINPGNSGGPLTSIDGFVIGINTAKLSSTDIEGIGFAIPITEALPVANSIIRTKSFNKPSLGVYVSNVSETSLLDGQTIQGVLVENVIPGQSAEKSGILPGDIIIKINNDVVSSTTDLSTILAKYNARESISLTIIRDSRYEKIKVIL